MNYLTNAMKKAILSSEIGLRFRPSKFLWGWWVVFSILVLFSLVYSLPTLWAVLGLLAYTLWCAWQWTQLLATRWPWSVHALRVDVFGHMSLTNAKGQAWSFKLKPDTVVHPACMVLHLNGLELQENEAGELDQAWFARWLFPKRLLILPDQADAQSLQALRVWLKWGLRE